MHTYVISGGQSAVGSSELSASILEALKSLLLMLVSAMSLRQKSLQIAGKR